VLVLEDPGFGLAEHDPVVEVRPEGVVVLSVAIVGVDRVGLMYNLCHITFSPKTHHCEEPYDLPIALLVVVARVECDGCIADVPSVLVEASAHVRDHFGVFVVLKHAPAHSDHIARLKTSRQSLLYLIVLSVIAEVLGLKALSELNKSGVNALYELFIV